MSKPTRADLLAAATKTLKDVIAPDLRVLFCGINPGLYTAWAGHHFARPGNRFWPTMFASGFTPRLFAPSEHRELLPLGYGLTNVVARASARADELTDDELRDGGAKLMRKVRRWRPRWLAILGVGAYRVAFGKPKAELGLHDERIGETRVWVLPSPSGLNAHYQAAELGRVFRELREVVESEIKTERG